MMRPNLLILAAWAFAIAAPLAAPVSRAQTPDVDVRSRLHLAEQLVRERRHAEAIELFREIDRARPDDPRILAGLKTCLLETKAYAELEEILRAEAERWPDDPAVLEQLGTARARQGERADAARWWRRIIEVQEHSRGSYELVADLFVRNRMLDEATAAYAAGDSLYPGEFTRQAASLHEMRFEFAAATREYLRYLESNPTALSFVEGKLLRIGESEGGLGPVIERVRAAAQRHDVHAPGSARAPKDPKLRPGFDLLRPDLDSGRESSELDAIFYRKLLGDLCLEAGDHECAAREYMQLADESPGQVSALLVFGKRCQSDGAYEVAIRVFERMIEKPPDVRAVPGALTEIARCQVQIARWDDALATYRRLQDEYPETTYALAARFESAGILLRGRGRPEEAEASYRELLAISKGPWAEADPQFGVAECALWVDDVERARGIYRAIREREFSDTTHERALYEEGNTFLYEGRFAEADSLFKQVASKYPKGAHVNDALGSSILVNTNADEASVVKVYGSALHRLRTGRAVEAAALLEGLEREAPRAALVDEAALLLARALRASGRPREAALACDRAVASATVPDLAADAHLLKADILAVESKDSAAALAEYEEILVGFPDTLAADRAREEVGALKRALP